VKPEPRTLNFMVTHFNTQRLVRMELTPEGATYKARENEFLRLHDPDIHLTDVMEAPDGSLLVLDTGGWFRIGCPSSLMAKPDVTGAVYRVKPTAQSADVPALAEVKSKSGLNLAVVSGVKAVIRKEDPNGGKMAGITSRDSAWSYYSSR